MNRTFNIVIRGAWFENKGAEAMIRTVQRELNIRLKNVNIFLVCPENNAQYAYISGITPISPIESRLSRYIPGRIARRIKTYNYLLRNFNFSRMIKSIRCFDGVYSYVEVNKVMDNIYGFDAVIDISGFNYGDPWGATPVHTTLSWVEFCLKNGKKYIFLPQCWGTFDGEGIAAPTKTMIEKASLYYARDQVSQLHLANLLSKEQAEIPLMPDLAFKFNGANPMVGNSILCDLGCKADSNQIIGFSPNINVYIRTKLTGTANEYIKLLIKLCDHCMEKYGVSVVLLPNYMRTPNDKHKDDRFLCGIIQSAIKNQNSCFVLTKNLTAEAIKSVIGHFDLLVGSRFHTIVFALSQSIPSIALSWSHKYRELLQYFSLDNYVFEHTQLDTGAVIHMLDRAWSDREANKQAIKKALPPVIKDVDAMFDHIVKVIKT